MALSICPFRRRTCFTPQSGYLRRLHCPPFRRWRLLTPTSAAMKTAIIACGFTATTTGTDVGGSLNTAGTQFTAVQAGGYAIPMGIGVILNTLARRETGTASTTTTTVTTATDSQPLVDARGVPGRRPGAPVRAD